MGLLTDIKQNTEVKVEAGAVVIKKTKKGAMIVCPKCNGEGRFTDYPDYGYDMWSDCPRCHGTGAIEVSIYEQKTKK